MSFSVSRKVPSGVPRRLYSPLAWDSASLHHWSVLKVNHVLSNPVSQFKQIGLALPGNCKIGGCFCVRVLKIY